MAMTDDEMRFLREQVQEPVSVDWSDDRLNFLYTENGSNMLAAAAAIWRIKANSAAALTDITEDGSTRKFGDIYARLIKVAEDFEARATIATPSATARIRVRQIERP